MRSSNEYRALLAKINVQKGIYAEKEAEVNEELEQKIQLTVEKKKKWNNRFVISCLFMMVLLGVIYEFLKFFNEKEAILYFAIAMTILVLVILGIGFYYKNKLEKLNTLKEEDVEKQNLRNQIKQLNDQIASLVVSIIALNEHYYELSNIKEEKELQEKWRIYTNQIIMAVNKKYNFQATYNDYQEFLREYEDKIEAKENI